MRSEERQSSMEQTLRALSVELQRMFEAALSDQEQKIAKVEKENAALQFNFFCCMYFIFFCCVCAFFAVCGYTIYNLPNSQYCQRWNTV